MYVCTIKTIKHLLTKQKTKNTMKKVLTIAAITIVGFSAKAQTPSSAAQQQVKLTLSNAIELTFTGNNSNKGADVNLAFNTVNDYANGVESAAQQLKVRSNRKFDVSVKTSSANFTYAGSVNPAPSMPVSGVLGLKVAANGTGGTIASPFSATAYNGLSNSDAKLISNGLNGGNQTFSIAYEATPGFTYPAGTYTVDVIYTATQQ